MAYNYLVLARFLLAHLSYLLCLGTPRPTELSSLANPPPLQSNGNESLPCIITFYFLLICYCNRRVHFICLPFETTIVWFVLYGKIPRSLDSSSCLYAPVVLTKEVAAKFYLMNTVYLSLYPSKPTPTPSAHFCELPHFPRAFAVL